MRPTAFTIGLIIYSFIALFFVYTEFGIDSKGHCLNIFKSYIKRVYCSSFYRNVCCIRSTM